MQLIPTTERSHPFATAAQKCKFEERGYTEDEYFLYGTSNVYATKKGGIEIVCTDAPYINRMLVRRP